MNLKLERSGPWIGATGLLVMLWLVFTTPFLFAPLWGFLVHLAVLASFVPLLRSWARSRPASCIWVPGFAFVAWLCVNAVGVFVLGWSVGD